MPKQALIVDDSKAACRFLAKLLAEHHVESESVHSAEDALEFLRSNKPDVIFLDHNMPGMDGLETVKIIKGNPDTATIPVLMYTTEEGEVYLGQARALGAVDVLSKESVHERLEASLAKLGMGQGDASGMARTREAAVRGTPDWEDLLTRMQAELSRQMYLILTEEQIAQKSQMRWLSGNIKGNLEVITDEMVRRLEAKQDLRWEEQRAQGRGRARLLATSLVVLGVVTGLGFWWQGQRLDDLRRDYATGAAATRQQMDELRGVVAAAPRGAPVAAATTPPSVAPAPAPPPREAAVLRGGGGETLGRLLGITPGAGYEGLSDAGYLFSVGARGEIGYRLRQRYFAAANCIGDPLVDAQPGIVFRDSTPQLWFTAIEEPEVDLQPLSMLDDAGNCLPVEEEVASLRALLPNEPLLTGLSTQNEPVVLARP